MSYGDKASGGAEVRRRSDLHHDYYSLFVRDRASEAMPWELLNKLADVLNALSVYRDDPLGNFAKECDDRARALLARQQRKVLHDTRAIPDVSG